MKARILKRLSSLIAVLFSLYLLGLGMVLTGIASTLFKGWKGDGSNPTYTVTLDCSTYLGGNGNDRGEDIDVLNGYIYVTGSTASLDFPTAAALQPGYGGGSCDAFITKFTPSGSNIVFSTYLGGSGDDYGTGVDYYYDPYYPENCFIALAGYTTSSDFPTSNAYQPAFAGGGEDAFICKISTTGTVLLYSTYLGGEGEDRAAAVKVADERAYVTGYTASDSFPTHRSCQAGRAGGDDAFITKLSASGQLSDSDTFSTYLGGSGDDAACDLVTYHIGYSHAACVTGVTASADFPTNNSYQASLSGGDDAFITRLSASGSVLAASTYLGGNGDDSAESVAVGGDMGISVAGSTASADFPTISAYQACRGGAGSDNDIFITRFQGVNQTYHPDEDLSSLKYSTYLGGDENDRAYALTLDGKTPSASPDRLSRTTFPPAAPTSVLTAGTETPSWPASPTPVPACLSPPTWEEEARTKPGESGPPTREETGIST